MQGAQQLIQQAHGPPYRPADGQQAQQQRQATNDKQLLQGVPDFIDFIPRIHGNQHAAAITQVQQPAAVVALAEQLAAEPGIHTGLLRQPWHLTRCQPMHPHMAQALGQAGLQVCRVAFGGVAQVCHHGFG
ncbi:hypothetical protein D3C76_647020 [compost metagenome]